MGKSLVIVESPAKAKTINKYLGKDFQVKSCVGHVRDLPVSGSGKNKKSAPAERAKQAAETRKMPPEEREEAKKQRARESLVARMGVDPEHDWQAHYEVLPGKEKVIEDLRKSAREADQVYLATDLDREGEAIAWHLQQLIGDTNDEFRRVVFNEITQSAIREAFQQPSEVDLNKVNAQQARRFLDRVVGYMVSPLLWKKIARGLSAGRVQSVAVRLIVEREREIHAFVPEEYWEVHADTHNASQQALRLQVAKEDGKNFRPPNKATTDQALQALQAADYRVAKREDKPTQTKPYAPFITSTLQQAASTRLNFSVRKTMTLAQRLYEAGYITYMRTDSTNLSADAVASCRDFIQSQYGDRYLPEKPNSYTSQASAQEAHEAIRPSDVTLDSNQLQGMEPDAQRLYDLIWRQFVACQMPPADFLSTTVTVEAGRFELRARGRILQFDGFMKVQSPAGKKNEEDRVLPDVQVGDALTLEQLDPSQHFTQPPRRYTEASLVKELEKRGIGRPSTYAAIISTIQERGYVSLHNRRFYAEKMGGIVTDRLYENFQNLMDYGFTAEMEEMLDAIARGDQDWRGTLDEFYADFKRKLDAADSNDDGMRANKPTDTDIECPQCARPMQIRTASTGVFLSCSGYNLSDKNERCKHTMNLVPGEEAISADADDEEAESLDLRSRRRCPRCSTAMDSYLIDETRKLHICGNNPDCPGFEVEQGEFKIKGYDGPVIECDKCGADMQLKSGRYGKYFGCTSDECKNTRKLLKNGEPAPPKADPVPMPHLRCANHDDHYLLRDGAAGIFLAASQFPKHRETRAPTVEELKGVKAQLPEKYRHLADAPSQDPEGNPTVVRFSRKQNEQYVTSEKNNKATNWRAFYRDGRWVEDYAKASQKGRAGRKKSQSKQAETN